MGKKVSFIIPFYNQGIYIQETLDSVFNSSYQNFEVIIVNDGSDEENTKLLISFLEQLNDCRINVFHQENIGPSSARNFGIHKSNGEYLVFLDGDDCIEKDALDFMIKKMDLEVDVVFGDCQYFGLKKEIKKQYLPTSQQILITNPIAVCVLIRKSILNDINFDEHLNKLGLEDWELWINLYSKRCKFKYYPKVLFKIRALEKSRTVDVANINLAIVKDYIIKKHSAFFYDNYYSLFYENKQLYESINLRLGNFLLLPYRIIKKIIKK